MYLLDTNILILYLADDPAVVSFVDELRANKAWLSVSVISVVELFSSRALQEGDEIIIQRLLDGLEIVSVNSTLAHPAAIIRRTAGVTLGDAVIAATAQARHATFVTRDRDLVKKLKRTDVKTMVV
ncbi:hypothetical protein A3F28_02195 [Candidatus Uhrbacteria bacterium RIFCSPHIGHO2_12_FULL_57_11]|uniref:Ribonuclease VapC n=1 Tax=Candidatus Uhrbacteria bacterium RIFCSPHIGHO2_12_FULL_57_11 TaxID=1802398 RepID=A0A1F7UKY1_9BACT|nr:MAG: hypothetical protein A3F28_02195 [Candidatus Uhrbacteria bacterium RIFCSPHIGHO2_12_FULL_57_11]